MPDTGKVSTEYPILGYDQEQTSVHDAKSPLYLPLLTSVVSPCRHSASQTYSLSVGKCHFFMKPDNCKTPLILIVFCRRLCTTLGLLFKPSYMCCRCVTRVTRSVVSNPVSCVSCFRSISFETYQ